MKIMQINDATCSDCEGKHYAKGMCRLHYFRNYRRSNPERIARYTAERRDRKREYDARRYTEHPEPAKARSAAWYAANREYAIKRQSKYNATRPAQLLAIKRRYRERHRDALKDAARRYGQAKPEIGRARSQRRRARVRDAFVEDVAIRVLIERDKRCCGACGNTVATADASIGHITPLALGGEHSYANTRLEHMRCNQRRGTTGPAQTRMLG